MVALSRCLSSVATLVVAAEGARVARKKQDGQATKFIAGVPVLNYHAAYGGEGSLSALEESREEEWIVTLQPGATDAQIAALCQTARQGCKLSGHPDKGGVAFLDMRGTEKDLEAVIKSNRPVVKFVEPDQEMYMIPELEADPNSSPSWGLNRVGASGRSSNQGANTHIYVLDTGVRTTHNDFGSRASPAVDYSTGSPVECNGDLGCAADRQGHGTHCAGSAGGATFGVATAASIYGIKVLGDNGAGSFAAIIGAIDWLAAGASKPAVGSMSLGGTCPMGFCAPFGSVTTAVDTAVAAGVTVVVAGGNSNSDACGFVPAFVPSAITVGSTDSNDVRSSFSNYGKCTNIWAPGSAITSASHEDDTGAKTFSGTSMACPHVAGAAAMILERHPEAKSPEVLERLLAKSAQQYITDLKPDDINALLYVAADAPPPKGPVESPPAECPFYCGMRLCLLDACVNNCDFCADSEAPEETEAPEALVQVQGNGCANSQDRRVIRNKYDTLRKELHSCATSCLWGGEECRTTCVKDMGFTDICTGCLLDFGGCGRSQCMWQCIPIPIMAEDNATAADQPPSTLADSPRCRACVAERCMPPMMTCSGLSEDEIPPR